MRVLSFCFMLNSHLRQSLPVVNGYIWSPYFARSESHPLWPQSRTRRIRRTSVIRRTGWIRRIWWSWVCVWFICYSVPHDKFISPHLIRKKKISIQNCWISQYHTKIFIIRNLLFNWYFLKKEKTKYCKKKQEKLQNCCWALLHFLFFGAFSKI